MSSPDTDPMLIKTYQTGGFLTFDDAINSKNSLTESKVRLDCSKEVDSHVKGRLQKIQFEHMSSSASSMERGTYHGQSI